MRSNSEKSWKNAVFCVFDCPDRSTPYEERVEFLQKFQTENKWPSFLKVIDTVQCNNRDHLHQYFNEILKNKGEGVMLREPGSTYQAGRSKSMKRYKEFQDTEVRVIKNMSPHGLDCQQ